MVYYQDISNEEMCLFHNLKVHNFSIKLSEVLHKSSGVFDNKLFNVEEVVEGTIYRIVPLFYTSKIYSTNVDDKIIDDKILICLKLEKETFLTFIGDENDREINDYQSNVSYFSVGDSLTDSEYNAIVNLFRRNNIHYDTINLHNGLVQGLYGDYCFEISGLIVDNGIEITSTSNMKIKLMNNSFNYSTYVIKLKVLRMGNPNIDDNIINGKSLFEVNVELVKKEFVDIPVSNLEVGDIILYETEIEITHDIPVIPNVPKSLQLEADKSTIQIGEKLDVFAKVYDIGGVIVGSGHDVYFYEVYNPILSLSSPTPIIQSGDTAILKARLSDIDGSGVEGERIDFYEVFTPSISLSSPTPIIQVGDTAVLQAKVVDEDGSLISDVRVDFYEEFTPNLSIRSNASVIQSGDTSDISVTLKDDDGSLVSDVEVYFYVIEGE